MQMVSAYMHCGSRVSFPRVTICALEEARRNHLWPAACKTSSASCSTHMQIQLSVSKYREGVQYKHLLARRLLSGVHVSYNKLRCPCRCSRVQDSSSSTYTISAGPLFSTPYSSVSKT